MILEPWNTDTHPVCFITGDTGDGKTWRCTRMAEEAIQAGATVILADPAKRLGYRRTPPPTVETCRCHHHRQG